MLKLLIKKQLMEIFKSHFYDQKKNTRRKRSVTIALFALFAFLIVGVFGGTFTFVALAMCKPMLEVGMGWLYFAILGMISIAFGAFGSVFSTYSGLYLAKDNDLLLSLPIPVGVVIASRLFSVYLLGLGYSASVSVPAMIVYLVNAFTPMALVGSLIGVLLISIFVTLISCLLGLVVAKASLKLKNKSFVTVILSVVLIALYYFVYFNAQRVITELISNAAVYGERIKGSAYILYLLGRSSEGDPTAIFSAVSIAALLTLIIWRLLSRSFIGIATSTGTVESKAAVRVKYPKQRGMSSALLRAELSHFTSSANYMLNCGLGTLMLLISAVALLIFGDYVTEFISTAFWGRKGFTELMLCAAICLIASSNTITAPSISLEGRSLWIKQSLPMTGWQLLLAKLELHFLLTAIPAALCVLASSSCLELSIAEFLLELIFIMIFCLFCALFGLILGVQSPSFTWTNEQTPIKQSLSSLLALFGGWLFAAAFGGAYVWFGHRMGNVLYLTVSSLVFAALSGLIIMRLKRVEAARVERM